MIWNFATSSSFVFKLLLLLQSYYFESTSLSIERVYLALTKAETTAHINFVCERII